MSKHVFRCAECSQEFESDGRALRCPSCGSKVLIHQSGESLRKKCACGGSCCGCSGCSH